MTYIKYAMGTARAFMEINKTEKAQSIKTEQEIKQTPLSQTLMVRI